MLKNGRKAPNFQRTGKKRATFKFTLWEIAEAAGVSYNAVRAASKRKIFDRQDLRSIAHYIVATYIKIKLKEGKV